MSHCLLGAAILSSLYLADYHAKMRHNNQRPLGVYVHKITDCVICALTKFIPAFFTKRCCLTQIIIKGKKPLMLFFIDLGKQFKFSITKAYLQQIGIIW